MSNEGPYRMVQENGVWLVVDASRQAVPVGVNYAVVFTPAGEAGGHTAARLMNTAYASGRASRDSGVAALTKQAQELDAEWAKRDAQYLALKAENERLGAQVTSLKLAHHDALEYAERLRLTLMPVYYEDDYWWSECLDCGEKGKSAAEIVHTAECGMNKLVEKRNPEEVESLAALTPSPATPAAPLKVCENCRWDDDVDEGYRCNGCGSAMEKWEAIPPTPAPEPAPAVTDRSPGPVGLPVAPPTATVKSCENCGHAPKGVTRGCVPLWLIGCGDGHANWTPRPAS